MRYQNNILIVDCIHVLHITTKFKNINHVVQNIDHLNIFENNKMLKSIMFDIYSSRY